jgi:hypothetical protein
MAIWAAPYRDEKRKPGSILNLTEIGIGPGLLVSDHGKAAVQGHTKRSVTRHPDRMAHRVMAQARNRFLLNAMLGLSLGGHAF